MERLETTETARCRDWAEAVRLNRGRMKQMCTSTKHLYTFLCLFFMFIFAGNVQNATAADTKVDPNVSFSSTGLTATVGQLQFTRPTLRVTNSTTGKSISRCFTQTWTIKDANGKNTKGTDALERTIYIDNTTGTSVIEAYGGVTIGKKAAGKVTVTVTLTPTAAYANTYNSATASYTNDIKSPTVTAEFYNGSTLLNSSSTLLLHSYKNQWDNQSTTSIPVPTPYIHYDLDNSTHDVSSYYDYSYTTTSGFSESNDKITATYSDKEVTGTLTITATPKDAYKGMLGSTPITNTFNLKETFLNSQIRTYIKFVSHEQDVLRYRNAEKVKRGGQQSTYSPDLIITDAEGNDITSLVTRKDLFTVTTAAQNAFNKYTTDPHDSTDENNYLYKENKDVLNAGVIQDGARLYVQANIHNHPDDYILTVTAKESGGQTVFGASCYASPVAASGTTTINGQFYNQYDEKCKTNQYTINENQYVLRVHKRVPKVVLTPDPSKVTIAEKYTMNGFSSSR